MKDNNNRKARRRSVWLPATLLFLLLWLVGGTTYWLTLTPPPGDVPPGIVGEMQTSPKHPIPANIGQDRKQNNFVMAAAKPGKPSETRLENSPPSSEDIIDKSSYPPQEAKNINEFRPPALVEMVTKKHETVPPAPPAEKPASRTPVKSIPTAAKRPTNSSHMANTNALHPTAPVLEAIVPNSPDSAYASPKSNTTIAQLLRPAIPNLPRPSPNASLPQAPDPALVEESLKGPLPIVGRDGREAWQVYARPFDQLDKRPRIGVVLYGLGTSGAATRSAIQGLPGAITLAFSPYADGLGNWIADARAAGHEILLMVPMEPRNYPEYDPRPQALLTSLTRTENTDRLEWVLGLGVGYVGVTYFMGSRFTNSTQHMRALFRNLRKRGLMFLESRVSARAISGKIAAAAKVPFASNALYIDNQASRPAIDGQLAEAERQASELGAVVVMGFLYPVTLERVAKWAATVQKRGFTLAPVSAIAKRQN